MPVSSCRKCTRGHDVHTGGARGERVLDRVGLTTGPQAYRRPDGTALLGPRASRRSAPEDRSRILVDLGEQRPNRPGRTNVVVEEPTIVPVGRVKHPPG